MSGPYRTPAVMPPAEPAPAPERPRTDWTRWPEHPRMRIVRSPITGLWELVQVGTL